MKAEENYRLLVAKAKELTDLDITYAKSRRFEVVMVKACVANILSRYFGYTTLLIGKLIGMHHSTVIHHLRNHSDRLRQEDEYSELYDQLSKYTSNNDTAPMDVDGIVSALRACMCV